MRTRRGSIGSSDSTPLSRSPYRAHQRLPHRAALHVDVGHAVLHHGGWKAERPLTPTGAQMNVAYALAVATIDGEALMRQFAPARIGRDDAAGALGRGRTRLRVTFTDGATLERDQVAARSALEPISNAEIVAKFRSIAGGLLRDERRARVEELVLLLEGLADLEPLLEVLAPAADSLFERA